MYGRLETAINKTFRLDWFLGFSEPSYVGSAEDLLPMGYLGHMYGGSRKKSRAQLNRVHTGTGNPTPMHSVGRESISFPSDMYICTHLTIYQDTACPMLPFSETIEFNSHLIPISMVAGADSE